MARKTPPHILAQKNNARISCLTAYSAPMASLLDPHCDMLLVGDSLGMVLYGMESTLPVTLDMMAAHGKAVASRAKNACVVVDLPFGSYQGSPEAAFDSAAYILAETGADAIKLEGGELMAETIHFLSQRGVPVCAHIGLQPQSVRTLGGYKQQGADDATAKQLLADARAVTEAGAFAVVLEAIPASLATKISQSIAIPTIGIGAGSECDGQVLVSDDMLGLHDGHIPTFVTQYAQLTDQIKTAAAAFNRDVKSGQFNKNPKLRAANSE